MSTYWAPIRYSAEEKKNYCTERNRLKELIQHNLGISIQDPSNIVDLVETYKILNGFEGLKPACFFQEVSQISLKETRGTQAKKLLVKKPNLDLRKYSFAYRTVKEWNSLPLHLRQRPSVAAFKKHLNILYVQ